MFYKKVMKLNILLILSLLVVNLVLAVPITYEVTINGLVDEQPLIITKSEIKDCESKCSYPIPNFESQEDFIFNNYSIDNPSELIKAISFESNNQLTSSLLTDSIIVEVIELKEELKIGRLVTKNLNLGQNNIVLQLENIGQKDITNAYITISGDGIKTISKSTINLPKEQSDFVTAVVSIVNSGDIDIIIKAYSDDLLLGQTIESIFVNPPEEDLEKETTPAIIYVNETYAKEEIDMLWEAISKNEKNYFLKEAEEYNLPDLIDGISDTKEEIKQLQLSYSSLTKEAFDNRVEIILRSLEDINTQIDLAQPKELTDKIKENLGLIATTLGVIVSSLTAFGLVKSHTKHKEEKSSNKIVSKLNKKTK